MWFLSVWFGAPGTGGSDLGAGQDIALAEGRKGPVAVWVSGKEVRVLEPGAASARTVSESGAFPSVVALRDGAVLAAWEENGAITTRRIE